MTWNHCIVFFWTIRMGIAMVGVTLTFKRVRRHWHFCVNQPQSVEQLTCQMCNRCVSGHLWRFTFIAHFTRWSVSTRFYFQVLFELRGNQYRKRNGRHVTGKWKQSDSFFLISFRRFHKLTDFSLRFHFVCFTPHRSRRSSPSKACAFWTMMAIAFWPNTTVKMFWQRSKSRRHSKRICSTKHIVPHRKLLCWMVWRACTKTMSICFSTSWAAYRRMNWFCCPCWIVCTIQSVWFWRKMSKSAQY